MSIIHASGPSLDLFLHVMLLGGACFAGIVAGHIVPLCGEASK
jgi:hypothetical protein